MILIQIILVFAVLAISIHFMRSRGSSRTNAYKKMALVLFVMAAIVTVLFPELLTTIANALGVGRGSDLLLYGLTVVIIFQLFNNYAKDKHDQRRLVELSRKVAILEAQTLIHKK